MAFSDGFSLRKVEAVRQHSISVCIVIMCINVMIMTTTIIIITIIDNICMYKMIIVLSSLW